MTQMHSMTNFSRKPNSIKIFDKIVRMRIHFKGIHRDSQKRRTHGVRISLKSKGNKRNLDMALRFPGACPYPESYKPIVYHGGILERQITHFAQLRIIVAI